MEESKKKINTQSSGLKSDIDGNFGNYYLYFHWWSVSKFRNNYRVFNNKYNNILFSWKIVEQDTIVMPLDFSVLAAITNFAIMSLVHLAGKKTML